MGFLLAISAFLASYDGHSITQKILSKIAALAAIGIALVPCLCPGYCDPRSTWVHGFSAGVMFLVLALFCYTFFDRAKNKYLLAKARNKTKDTKAIHRCVINAFCGGAIVLSILVVIIDVVLDGALVKLKEDLIFICEAVGLGAFGISWLTASRAFPLITTKKERLIPFASTSHQ